MISLSRRSFMRLLASILVIVMGLTLSIVGASAKSLEQSGWTLVWGDEFGGSGQPSSSNWNYHVGNGYNPGSGTFDGWGNGEWEWYRPSNCYQSGGNLVIRADYNSTPTSIASRDWYQFSCRITTDSKRSITYGAIEARINMPSKIGTWPAFWMMGDACDDTSTSSYNPSLGTYNTMATNWASCGEVDIMEHRNTETVVFQNLFWDTRTGLFPWAADTVANAPTTYNAGNVAAFHTYRLEWTSTQLQWYVDGNIAKTQNITAANQEEFRKPFHLIFNLALAGSFPGTQPNQTDFPMYMYVDYVRVYRAGGTNSTPTPPSGGPAGYTFCTNENGTCSFSGTASVAYGANGAFFYRTATNSIACNNATFGDPIPGTVNACYYQLTSSGSSQGVVNVSSNQARVWYQCASTCSYVILHYIRPGLGQQNVQMTYNGSQSRWEYLVTGITSGQMLQYQFTYNDGVQHDTPWYTWTKP